MKALVTGATGFVGPYLIRHLTELGDEVIETDRSTGLDICDAANVRKLFERTRPEVVYHLAGDSDVGGSWNHPADTFRANAEGTLHILDAARSTGVGRVVSIGSADVYGTVTPEELPLTESSDLRPVSPYAASKVAAEYLGLQAWLGYGLEVIRVRAFNHLGPGQSVRFVTPAIAQRIVENERSGATSVPVGNLSPQRDLTDVRDVVRAYRLLATDGVPGEVYNVCSGRSIAIRELAESLLALATTSMELTVDPELSRPVDIPVLRGDNTKLTAATGWRPEISLDTTLSELMDERRSQTALRS